MIDEPSPEGPYKRELSDWGPRYRQTQLFYPVTVSIVAINLVIFGLMCITTGGEAFFNPSRQILMAWGADYGPLTLTGDFWRIISNCFVHIGVLHIALNMYALWSVGPTVERLYGS